MICYIEVYKNRRQRGAACGTHLKCNHAIAPKERYDQLESW